MSQINRIFLILILNLIFPLILWAKPYKLSLFLSDSYSKGLIEIIGELEREFPEIREKVAFQVLTSYSKPLTEEKDTLAMEVLVFHLMDRTIVEKFKPYILKVITRGGKVYGVSGVYDKEHKTMGILQEEMISKYFKEGGKINIKNMLLYILNKDFNLSLPYSPPLLVPEWGIYLKKEKRIVEEFSEFLKEYGKDKDLNKPWIGVFFYKNSFVSGNLKHIDALIEALEEEGFNVLPVYGWPQEKAIEKYFFDENGASRVRLIVAFALKIGLTPKEINLMGKLGVPILNVITLYKKNFLEWKETLQGLDIYERSWQVATPELGGIIEPVVVASKERHIDRESGVEFMEEVPIDERIKKVASRVKAWINLQEKSNAEKKVAILYYNYPPGKQNIGASYLKVIPDSLWLVLERLKREGYTVNLPTMEDLFKDLFNYGRNLGNWAKGEIHTLVSSGIPILLPIEKYKKWFETLPKEFQAAVIASWGEPEKCNVMCWESSKGEKYIIIPGVKYGNIFLAPQPSRGGEQDPSKLYHDLTFPPHHQYIAFYLWLKKEFKADALIHFGTHGTHEWLPGKEVGLSEEDAPDILLQDLPNIYVYIVDNVGEGLQAKRRGLAVIIDHMTPPFDKSGLNKELRNIKALLDEYSVAKDKSPLLAEAKLKEINELAKKIGINKDLGLEEFITDKDIEALEEYLEEIDNTNVPLGLHTFGKIPEEKFIESTLSAMLSYDKSLKEEEKVKKRAEYENRIRESGERELNSLILALEGKYIPSGQGGDPLRAPYSLPTGKNFYAFDPSKIPSKSIYALGVNLAKELIEKYRETHKTYPDKIAFNLWATETIRHEGIMESQILYLLGIKPKWDERGRVIGLEVIPASEMQRPRIDVVIIASGLYRDLFSNLIGLLDQAVNLAKDQEEKENFVRKNYLQTKEKLKAMKISEEVIEKLAGVRIFSEPPGSYGTNLDKIIALSNTWESEKEVVEVFFKRLSFGYGQGFWGNWNEVDNKLNMELGIRLFKNALSGSKIAIHSRSTNLYATLDNDDFFQYLGGTAMAIRALDGKNPELYVTNLSNPHKVGQESLQKFMGRELRSRYLNPQWIKTMLKEGYAGARFIDKVVEHLWGWQVTVPEIVDSTKWKEIYETYVLDKYGLNIKDYFKGSNNFWAYQSIVARLLEVTRKKYWNPEREVVENLAKEYAATVKEVGLACCDHTCNNPLLTKYTTNILLSVPTLKPEEISKFLKALEKVKLPPSAGEKLNPSEKITSKQALAPGGKMKNIEGYEVEEKTINSLSASSAPIPYLFLLGILIFFSLIIYGFKRNKRGL